MTSWIGHSDLRADRKALKGDVSGFSGWFDPIGVCGVGAGVHRSPTAATGVNPTRKDFYEFESKNDSRIDLGRDSAEFSPEGSRMYAKSAHSQLGDSCPTRVTCRVPSR